MSETTELDKTRRYLVPIGRLVLPGQPDVVHLTVYQWVAKVEEWFTGLALCGYSTEGEPLPEGTQVTCAGCSAKKDDFDRYLAPGHRPEDDDPAVLRASLQRITDAVQGMCNCCATNRDLLVLIRRELGIADEWDTTSAEQQAALEDAEQIQ